MKKIPIVALSFFLNVGAFAQTLFVPSGTSGIGSSGSSNVGIGVATPSNTQSWNQVLDVRGGIHSKIIASSNGAGYITGLYSHTSWGGAVGTETNHNLQLLVNYIPRVTINTSGYAGFGSMSPAARVHITNSNAREALRVYLDGNTTNYLSMWQGTGAGVIDPIGTGVLQLGYDQTTNVLMGLSSVGTNNSAKVGIGTNSPLAKLDVRGDLVLESGTNPVLYTGTGAGELNRFLQMINSPGLASASGLKAGGVLVSDSYSYANPGKNDLVVKGKIGIGTASPAWTIDVNGYIGSRGQAILEATSTTINVGDLASSDGTRATMNFWTNDGIRMTLDGTGQLGIGTTTPDAKLSVKGQIHAQEVKVDLTGSVAPDYVFEKDYNLPSLAQIQSYITANKHLPEVPSAKEMEKNGIKLGEMNLLLLKKVEELTLYILEQERRIQHLERKATERK